MDELTQNGLFHNLTLEEGDLLVYNLGDLHPGDRGRIVEFTLNLKAVCPNRRLAVAATLTERDEGNQEFSRGVRTYVIPPLQGSVPRDILFQPIRFILPEELDVSHDGVRRLTVRVDAHYIDHVDVCRLPDV